MQLARAHLHHLQVAQDAELTGSEAEDDLLRRGSLHCMPDGLNVVSSASDAPMSIFGTMHALAKMERTSEQRKNFKESIIQWSTAYGVTYALILTISFSLLVQQPADPPESLSLSFFRPQNEAVDVCVIIFFYLFATQSAMDSAWGMLLCAEWGVRAVAVPADLFEEFIASLSPVDEDSDTTDLAHTHWSFRFLEPRAVHPGLPRKGLFTKEDGIGIGFIRSAAWDPFYFIDRSVQSLFFSTTCLIYLNRGLLPCAAVGAVSLLLWLRVKWYLKSVISALFKTIAKGKHEQPASPGARLRRGGSVNSILAAAAAAAAKKDENYRSRKVQPVEESDESSRCSQ
ncbi:hypothetical protein AB1Y20_017631 [Prymnesium parvum]|uniref:Uncharacterized protein n=1 Tax=Prymnesium parvum TaxID=97485 RepID=A0AB34JPM5_PRYPA